MERNWFQLYANPRDKQTGFNFNACTSPGCVQANMVAHQFHSGMFRKRIMSFILMIFMILIDTLVVQWHNQLLQFFLWEVISNSLKNANLTENKLERLTQMGKIVIFLLLSPPTVTKSAILNRIQTFLILISDGNSVPIAILFRIFLFHSNTIKNTFFDLYLHFKIHKYSYKTVRQNCMADG